MSYSTYLQSALRKIEDHRKAHPKPPKAELYKNYELSNLSVMRGFSVHVQRLQLVSTRQLTLISHEGLPIAARTRSRKPFYPIFIVNEDISQLPLQVPELEGSSKDKQSKQASESVSIPSEVLTPSIIDLTPIPPAMKQEMVDMIDAALASCSSANEISAGKNSGEEKRTDPVMAIPTFPAAEVNRSMAVGSNSQMRTPGSNLKSILKDTGSAKTGRKREISFAKGDALEEIKYIESKKRRRISM